MLSTINSLKPTPRPAQEMHKSWLSIYSCAQSCSINIVVYQCVPMRVSVYELGRNKVMRRKIQRVM